MSTGQIRPRRTTTNLGLRVPGDTDPADFVGDIGNLADDVDATGEGGLAGPPGPAGPPGEWQVMTASRYAGITPTPGVLLIDWKPWNSTKEPNGSNLSFYNNAKLVSLIEKANSSFDPAVQKKNYYAAQEIVTKEQAAVVGVYEQETSLAIERNLHDVWLNAAQGEPVFSDAYFGE